MAKKKQIKQIDFVVVVGFNDNDGVRFEPGDDATGAVLSAKTRDYWVKKGVLRDTRQQEPPVDDGEESGNGKSG